MINELTRFGKVLVDESLKKYNSYRIETTAKYVVFPSDKENLLELLKYIKTNNLKYLILGNGSNVLLCDDYFDGIIIKLDEINDICFNDLEVKAGAGVMMPKLTMEAINRNLKGLEWASAIPGCIGGSVVGNAGAYNECIFDYIKDILIIDENLSFKIITKDDVDYSYRYTSFKKNKKLIIVEVTLKLQNGNKEESLEIVKRRRDKRIETQPLDYPSAGSVFRNPEGDAAGRIIEQEVHLKGTSVGGATVSKKHANFIINEKNATGEDIRKLIKLVHDKVLEKTNIDLILEQEIIDWDNL